MKISVFEAGVLNWDGVLKVIPNSPDLQAFFERVQKLGETVRNFIEPKKWETFVQQSIHQELLSSVLAYQVHALAIQIQLLSQKVN